MKRKRVYCLVIILVITLSWSWLYMSYRSEMGNVLIVNDISGSGDNYEYTYLRVIVPEEQYHNEKTLYAIYFDILSRRGNQNWLTIVFYDSWESLRASESYHTHTFKK